MEDRDPLFQFQTKRPETTCQDTARRTTLEKFCTELIVVEPKPVALRGSPRTKTGLLFATDLVFPPALEAIGGRAISLPFHWASTAKKSLGEMPDRCRRADSEYHESALVVCPISSVSACTHVEQ
jgi:hypothetical protein